MLIKKGGKRTKNVSEVKTREGGPGPQITEEILVK